MLGSIQKLDPGGSSFRIFQIVAMPLLWSDVALSSPIVLGNSGAGKDLRFERESASAVVTSEWILEQSAHRK